MLLTRAPLYLGYCYPFLVDLHVLGTPPAFVLSQDQTLRGKFFQTFIVEFETWLDYLLITSILAKVENSAKIDLWLCTLIVKEQHSNRSGP